MELVLFFFFYLSFWLDNWKNLANWQQYIIIIIIYDNKTIYPTNYHIINTINYHVNNTVLLWLPLNDYYVWSRETKRNKSENRCKQVRKRIRWLEFLFFAERRIIKKGSFSQSTPTHKISQSKNNTFTNTLLWSFCVKIQGSLFIYFFINKQLVFNN